VHMSDNRLYIWRTRISQAASIGFGSILVLTGMLPWLPLPPALFYLSLLGAIITGIAVVICTPGIFNQWHGFLGCLALVMLVNLWAWVLSLITIPLPTRLVNSIFYLTILLWFVGFVAFPLAFMRLLWRHDITCLMFAILQFVPIWTLILLTWRIGGPSAILSEDISLESGFFWATFIGIPPLLLSVATLMFFVHLIRLLWHELN